MKLTLEQIKSVTFGALCVKQTEKGIAFEKCTEKQVAAWYTLSEELGARSKTTSGVRLDFHTDSKALSFVASSGDKFEVLINDLPRYRIHAEAHRVKGEWPVFELGEGHKRVTVVFPSHTCGMLSSVELDDGALLVPHEHKCKMLFIGDSITQGWNSRYDSLSYAWRVTRFFDANSVIQGVGGGFFHEGTLDEIPFDPDTVVIAYGTNDFGRFHTLDDMRERASRFMDEIARQFGKKRVMVITPIYRADWQKAKRMGTFSDACALVREEALRCGFEVVDGMELVPHNGDFMADAVHPNDLGFGVFAERLIRKML